MLEDKMILFENKKDCCGCTACMNICPKQAIYMEEDAYGFFYPVIQQARCIKCGRCKNVCSYQGNNKFYNVPKSAYAVAINDLELLRDSASGGAFTILARKQILQGGVVYGCAFSNENGKLKPKHIRVENEIEIKLIQGSKYVQSDLEYSYTEIKRILNTGKRVLFSGTPCQVAALKQYLDYDYENLITVDLICHGVTNVRIFQEWMEYLGNKINGEIIDFKFRDKSAGWGYKGKVIYKDKKNHLRTKSVPHQLSAYYSMFLEAEILRENCYSCKYAKKERVSDITVGDYWGINKEEPELVRGVFTEVNGISCMLINTEKGRQIFKEIQKDITLAESTFEKVAAWNEQLKCPVNESGRREDILKMFAESGYSMLERWYRKKLGWKRYVYILWNVIPVRCQRWVKRNFLRNYSASIL